MPRLSSPLPVRLLALTGLVLAGACGRDEVARSDFEASDEGWLLAGDADPRPELRAVGGNPGGHICGSDLNLGDVWYFVAPAPFLGNASRALHRRLTFDLKQSSIYNQVKGRDVVLQGSGYSLVYNLRATPGLDWTPYSVTLTASAGWKRDEPGFPDASDDELATVLGALSALRLRGEYVDGPDSACLDNVVLGVR